MPIIKCEICESTDIIKTNGVFVCKNCGIQYSIEEVKKLIVNGSPNISTEDYVIKSGTLVKYRGKASEIVIPDDVTNIGAGVFERHNGITSVVIPDSTLSIEKAAFSGCSNLLKVIIGNSVKNIGEHAFKNCSSLREVIIPDSVLSIEKAAFCGCSNLLKVIIGKSVKNIDVSAFSNCYSLKDIEIPCSVSNIGEDAFQACFDITSLKVDNNNKCYCSIDGSLFSKDKTLLIWTVNKEEYFIPDCVTVISKRAFCSNNKLTCITIPESVEQIEKSTFNACHSLTNIEVNDFNKKYCSIDGVLFNKNKTCLIKYPRGKKITTYIIPDTVEIIDDCAFFGCSNIKEIKIPNSIMKIGSYAFCDCTNLSDLSIPESIKHIEDSAFFHSSIRK